VTALRLALATALLGAASAAIEVAAAEPAGPPQEAVAGAARKAPGDSLLFSSQTLGLIEQARRGHGRPTPVAASGPGLRSEPPAPPGIIHLSAILYRAPDDWRIWLNGRSFTPAARPGAIEILAVTADAVQLTWRAGAGQRARRIELRPNQSYLLASGEIVEGRLQLPRPAPPPAPPFAGPNR
jgi:hypothetical protein